MDTRTVSGLIMASSSYTHQPVHCDVMIVYVQPLAIQYIINAYILALLLYYYGEGTEYTGQQYKVNRLLSYQQQYNYLPVI